MNVGNSKIVAKFLGATMRSWNTVKAHTSLYMNSMSNILFFETAWSINAKFHVEPPSDGGTKVYINSPGHMTKMAAITIYGNAL